MAPLTTLPPCSEVLLDTYTNSSAAALNLTMSEDDDLDSDDLSALLYIVVTLLFYSMGIVVGIITYLKRERADMEEEKVFDMYLSMKRDPFNLHRQERVRQTAQFLRKLEMAKEAERLEKERLAALQATPTPTQQDAPQDPGHAADSDATGSESGNSPRRKRSKHVTISDCVPLRSPGFRPGGHGTSLSCTARGEDEDTNGGRMGHEAGEECVSGVSVYPLVISTAQTMVGSTTARPPPVAFYPPPPPLPHHHHHGHPHGASPSSSHPPPTNAATELELPPHLQQGLQPLPPTPVALPPTPSRPITTATANVSGGVASLTLVTPKPPEHERRGALPMGAKALHAPEDPKGETTLLPAGPPLAEPLSRRSTDKGFCPSIARVLDL